MKMKSLIKGLNPFGRPRSQPTPTPEVIEEYYLSGKLYEGGNLVTEQSDLGNMIREHTRGVRLRDHYSSILSFVLTDGFGRNVADSQELRQDIKKALKEAAIVDGPAELFGYISEDALLQIAADVAEKHSLLQSEGRVARENHSVKDRVGYAERGPHDLEGSEAAALAVDNNSLRGGYDSRGVEDVEGPEAGMLGVYNPAYDPVPDDAGPEHVLEGPDRQGPAEGTWVPRPTEDLKVRPVAPHVPQQNTPGLYDLEGPESTAPAPQRALGVTGLIPGGTKTPPATPAKPKPPKAASPEMGLTSATEISTSIPTPTLPPVAANGTAAEEPPLFKPFMPRSEPKQVPMNLLGKPRSRRGQQRDEVKGYLAEWGSGRAEDKLPLLFRDTLPGPGEKGKQMYPEMARQDSLKRFKSRFSGGLGLVG